LRESARFHKFFTENFAGMDRRQFVTFHILMIVHDFNVPCVLALPAEPNPPLVIHADAMQAAELAGEGLETIRRRRSQVVQTCGRVELG